MEVSMAACREAAPMAKASFLSTSSSSTTRNESTPHYAVSVPSSTSESVDRCLLDFLVLESAQMGVTAAELQNRFFDEPTLQVGRSESAVRASTKKQTLSGKPVFGRASSSAVNVIAGGYNDERAA